MKSEALFVSKVRTFRLFLVAILIVAASSVSGAYAQDADDHEGEHDSHTTAPCDRARLAAASPEERISGVPVYIIHAGRARHEAVCRATEALAEGRVDMEWSHDAVLAEALGDSGPDGGVGEISRYPYLAPNSPVVPGLPLPGPGTDRPARSHLYAAFIDPRDGVEYTFTSVAEEEENAEADWLDWITSTVRPLLEHRVPDAKTPVVSSAALAAAEAASGAPNYDARAWTLIADEVMTMPKNELAGGQIHGHGRVMGGSGANVRIYRLNARGGDLDYFLLDVSYTQTPRYDPFTFNGIERGNFWANSKTQLSLTVKTRTPVDGIKPTLTDYAPRTAVTGTTETFQVGGELGGSVAGGSGGVSAGYSVTRTQDSVDTSVRGDKATGSVEWTDQYNGFPPPFVFVPIPKTSTESFTGERLAVFRVPRTINDVVPAGLDFTPNLMSEVKGYVSPFIFQLIMLEYANWNIKWTFFAPEPIFSVNSRNITVSRSRNSATNPVIIAVTAQNADAGQKVTWLPKLQSTYLETNVTSGITGSGSLRIYPTATAVNSSTTITLDSTPSYATDSLRNGPIEITVTITD